MRAGRVPAWAGWIGVVLGVLAVASIFFLPLFGIVIWILAASGLLLSSARKKPVAPVAA